MTLVENIAGVQLQRMYDHTAPLGVMGRNSDNTFIKAVLDWEPDTKMWMGLPNTYEWIKHQYTRRKLGLKTVD